ncbi:hypothetical protein [Photobacterium damselae]|uniref:hypothetical protein n=1 Tax=Photobacterium damselae TaxID=38293 RepID=UPI002542F715
MNKFINQILLNIKIFICAICFVTTPVMANVDDSACQETGVVFSFFNGVQNTSLQAHSALQRLKLIHGEETEDGELIRYELLYNESDGFDDFVETFEQRLEEHEGLLSERFELFFEALQGGGNWWDKITDAVPSLGNILIEFGQWHEAATIELLTGLFGNPPTEINYAEHRLRIDNWVLEGKKLLFVAHSQGNLFANAAYDYALTKTSSNSVRVVHIAPASPTLNGPHTLADKDLVINGLRVAGSVASITDTIPSYLLRPPGVNNETDILGHGLIEIYINPKLEISRRVKSHINEALNNLETPPVEASSGFFTATLTWNGIGDVDLHTFEPNGSHVFYGRKVGTTGYLDVDNRYGNGPEHYYASCDINKLQTGTYRVAVANYINADHRTATVQISSWNDGVLGTKSVTLGNPTGSRPSATMFNVTVDYNNDTGSYDITVE